MTSSVVRLKMLKRLTVEVCGLLVACGRTETVVGVILEIVVNCVVESFHQ